MGILIFLIAMGASETRARKPVTAEPTTYLSAVGLDGAAGTRTFQVSDLLGFDSLAMTIDYTHANNGTLTLTCTVSDDQFTTKAEPTTCALASGTCNVEFAGIFATSSLSGDKTYKVVLGLNADRGVECVIAHGGTPSSSDVVTITGFAHTSGR